MAFSLAAFSSQRVQGLEPLASVKYSVVGTPVQPAIKVVFSLARSGVEILLPAGCDHLADRRKSAHLIAA